MNANVYERLRPLIEAQIDATVSATDGLALAARIAPDTSFIDDLGFDSLDIVELAMAAEEEFKIEVDDDLMFSTPKVSDLVALIEREIAA